MARASKLNNQKLPNVPPAQLLETILGDVLKAAAMSYDEWWALSPFPLIPLAIPSGDGREYRATQEGVNAAHELCAQVWRNREDFRQTFSPAGFNKVVFQAIGETILNSRFHLPRDSAERGSETVDDAFYSAMAADFEIYLNLLADAARPNVDRHVPCHLFHHDQLVPAFAVGPVKFLPRAEWIDRYVKNAAALDHIKRVESREISYDALRSQALAPRSDRDLHTAWEVLSAFGNFEWVATIGMSGHELSQSHHKASVIVGLAIDAIGLRFQVEDARRFTKAGRQHLYSEQRLATTPDGSLLGGWSTQIPGLGAAPGALARRMQAERPFLDAAGKLLDAYVQGRLTGSAPHLVERWANALYWVGEARREASDFMAVVNYGCAADGLSGAGGEAARMVDFAEAALNPNSDATPTGSLGISDVVRKVYREGRNKLAHGEKAGLFEDLSETRALGDALLVNLFDAVTFELALVVDQKPDIFNLKEAQAYRALETRIKQRT